MEVGGRPAKLNEKKGDGDLEREIKKRRHFFVGRTTSKFCSGSDKMRNAIDHQCRVKTSGREKKVNEKTYDIIFRQKKCNYKAHFKCRATAVSNSINKL